MSVRLQGGLGRLARLGTFVAAGVLLGALAWSATPGTTEAGGDAIMALNAGGDGVSCDASSAPDECTVPLGGRFTVATELSGPPAEGYIGFQSQIYFGDLTWNAASSDAENVWPDNQLPVRSPAAPQFGTKAVAHGGLTGVTPPFTVSHFAGALAEITLTCSSSPGSHEVLLVALSDTTALGTSYTLLDTTAVSPPVIDERELDLDNNGVVEVAPIADILTINCQVPPPTPTAQPQAQPTATATVVLPPTGYGSARGGDSLPRAWLVVGGLFIFAVAALALSSTRFRQRRDAK